MRILLLSTAVATISAAGAFAQADNLSELPLGGVVDFEVEVCSHHSDRGNINSNGVIRLPDGFEILTAEAVITKREHTVSMSIPSIRQPQKIRVSEVLSDIYGNDISGSLQSISDNEALASQIAILVGGLAALTVTDGTSKGEIHWTCFADGRRYSSRDGVIDGEVHYSIVRVVTGADIAAMLGKLSEALIFDDKVLLRDAIQTIRSSTSSSVE